MWGYITPIVDNQTEKSMHHEIATGMDQGFTELILEFLHNLGILYLRHHGRMVYQGHAGP